MSSSSSQAPIFYYDGQPLRVVVEVSVIGRSKIVRTLRSAGATIVATPEDASILIVDLETDGGRIWGDDWNKDKLIFEFEWVRDSVQAGRALLDADGFGGYRVLPRNRSGPTGVALLTPRTTPSDSHNHVPDIGSHTRAQQPQPVPLGNPLGGFTSHQIYTSTAGSSHNGQSMPFPSATGGPQPPPMNGGIPSYTSSQPFMHPMGAVPPQMQQQGLTPETIAIMWAQMTQMAQMAQMFQAHMPSGMPPGFSPQHNHGQPAPNSTYGNNPMHEGQATSSASSAPHNTFSSPGQSAASRSVHTDAQSMSPMGRRQRSSLSTDDRPDHHLPTARSQRGRGQTQAIHRKRVTRSPSPSSSAEAPSEGRPPFKKRMRVTTPASTSHKEHAPRRSRESANPWDEKHDVTPLLLRKASPKLSTGTSTAKASAVFVKSPGVPLKIWVQYDGFVGRKHTTTAIKAGQGVIVARAEDSDYIVLSDKSKNLKRSMHSAKSSRKAGTPIVTPAFITDCLENGSVLDHSDYAVKNPKPERQAAPFVKLEVTSPIKSQTALPSPGAKDITNPLPAPPTPDWIPESITVAGRKRYKFTAEEEQWIEQYIQVIFGHNPNIAPYQLAKELHAKVPHHSVASWHSWMCRHQDDIDQWRAEATPVHEYNATEDNVQCFGDEHRREDRSEDPAESESTYLTANTMAEMSDGDDRVMSITEREDFEYLVDYLSSIELGLVNDDDVWEGLNNQRPCRASSTWPGFYEKWEAQAIKAVKERR